MAATAMAPAAMLLSWIAGAAWGLPPVPPMPPAPPTPSAAPLQRSRSDGAGRGIQNGSILQINDLSQQARWQLRPSPQANRQELWMPLEVLQNQLGVSSRTMPSGDLKLEWFGRELDIAAASLRNLDDEVAVEISELLQAAGLSITAQGRVLRLQMPPTALLGVRSSRSAGQRRVVLDLAGPALLRRDGNSLWLGLGNGTAATSELEALGFSVSPKAGGLELQQRAGSTQRVFSLGGPARIVIDLAVAADGGDRPAERASPAQTTDPRLLALLGRDLQIVQQQRQGIRLNAVRLDPRSQAFALRPLTRSGGMEGLSSLQQLAARDDALVAINGGFFNRVKRLPLGAVKRDGRWLSGPILGRGVMAWSPGAMPRFGRLSLQESLSDSQGQQWPVAVLNSGYVQRGLSRYTADWGPTYRALSGQESALVLRAGRVVNHYDTAELELGVPLQAGETLVVARGGAELPGAVGDRLSLSSKGSNDLALAPFVVGGGPLLLQNGRTVLNGPAEGFSSGFLQQGAPRTVVASDGRQLWLITLEGTGDAGPSLGETAALLQQLGISDALNLDGGSSTGLVVGGVMTVKGRGVAGAVHHGLGLIPTGSGALNTPERANQPTARVR